MIEFISDQDAENTDSYEAYYNSVIVPMVEEDNKLKEHYRSLFWGYFWSILFLMTANGLVVLFNVLMHDRPISYEQLLLVNVVAIVVMFVPIYRYRKIPKNDILDAFIQFYGGWKHLKNAHVRLVHSPIIPPHESVCASHNVVGRCNKTQTEVRDTDYYNRGMLGKFSYRRKVSSGVILYMEYEQDFAGTILLFDRRGFYHKKKFGDLLSVGDKLQIPAANYFHIFTDNIDFTESMLPSLFFERILDMKEVFGAKHIYLEISGNYIRVYFEGARLYFDNYHFWSRKIDKNKFVQLHQKFEQIFLFSALVDVLREKL